MKLFIYIKKQPESLKKIRVRTAVWKNLVRNSEVVQFTVHLTDCKVYVSRTAVLNSFSRSIHSKQATTFHFIIMSIFELVDFLEEESRLHLTMLSWPLVVMDHLPQ